MMRGIGKRKYDVLVLTVLILFFTGVVVMAEKRLPNENGQPGSTVTVYDSDMPDYVRYINGRYAFIIDFPDSFIVAFVPENNDGVVFRIPDGSAVLRASGGHNTLMYTLDDYYTNTLRELDGELGYADKGDDWYVVSWEKDGRIFYLKQFVCDAYQNSFRISYPDYQKKPYDEIVSNIERSFIPGWKTGDKIGG